jgi:uncharacterized repeat protein (TIGR02543 family)
MNLSFKNIKRQQVIRSLSFILAIMFFINYTKFIAFALEDTSGPEILSITVDKNTATVGDAITYTIQTTEDTGFLQGYMLLKVGESSIGLGLTRQSDGIYVATLNVKNNVLNGSYQVTSVTLSDSSGNIRMYSQEQLEIINSNLAVTVTGTVEDTSGPEIQSIVLNKDTASVGDTVTYTVTVNDLSGISSATMIVSYEDNRYPLQITYQGSGTFTGTIAINNTFKNGSYNVLSISINDNAGNLRNYSNDEILAISPNSSFSIIGSHQDAEAPIIESITIDNTEVTVGDIVTYTVKIIETSDMASAWLMLSCGQFRKETSLVQQPDGTYKGIFKLDESFVNGLYDVEYISMDDNYWNHSYYSADELEPINPNLSFVVTGSAGDIAGPIIDSIAATDNEVIVGESIVYKLIIDEQSSFAWGVITLINETSRKYDSIDLNEDGTIRSDLIVDNSFKNGTYEVESVELYDVLENRRVYSAAEIAEISQDLSVLVSESTEDGKIPGLSEVSVSGAPIYNGSEITIDFDWTGKPCSGFFLQFINFEANKDINMWIAGSSMDESGHIHYTQPISEYSASGYYSLESVHVNYPDTDIDDRTEGNVYDCNFIVNNPNQDVISPKLIPDSITISQTAEKLIIEMECSETGSGLFLANFTFANQNGEYFDIQGSFYEDNLLKDGDKYRITEDIMDIIPDQYNLISVSLLDLAYNYSYYEDYQLPFSYFQINEEDRYVVTFDKQNGAYLFSKPVYVNTPVDEPVTPVQEGSIFAGWYVDADCTSKWDCSTDNVSSDMTLYAKWIDNTPAGSNVEVVDSTETVNLVFDTVLSGGKTVVVSLEEAVDESFFHIEGSAGFFDIKTTAEFDDSVKITVKYDPALLDESQVESELRLYQFKDGIPIDITDPATPVDTVNKTITGILTDHFCVFSVGLPLNHEVNVTYIGSTLTPVSEQKVLSCKVASVDSEINLDYTNVYIEYRIKGTDGSITMLPPVQCNEDGVASVQVELGADVYSVEASILENGYAAPAIDNSIVVVYDPTGGSVTGGGWIDSPEGSYMADLTATGKANFGFVSKYQKGAVVPSGNTEFQFKLGNLNFHSDSYEWLVVNKESKRAQYKGTGTINGAGQYKFMIWATDHGSGSDTFRIKIWNALDEDEVIYDNGSDQTIGGGQISVIVK